MGVRMMANKTLTALNEAMKESVQCLEYYCDYYEKKLKGKHEKLLDCVRELCEVYSRYFPITIECLPPPSALVCFILLEATINNELMLLTIKSNYNEIAT